MTGGSAEHDSKKFEFGETQKEVMIDGCAFAASLILSSPKEYVWTLLWVVSVKKRLFES